MNLRASRRRSLAKAITYRAIIVWLDFLAVYLLTGKVSTATTFMIVSNTDTSVGYFLHEQAVTLTAMVTKTASVSGTPTGMVTFFSNGVSLGTGTLSSGRTTLTTSSLSAGGNSLVAQYDGDANFAAANSAPLAEVVVGFGPPPPSLTVSQGQSLTVPLTLFAPAASNLSFMLSCSGLPANAGCSFDANPVMPGPGGTTVTLKLTTMAGSKLPPAYPNTPPPSSPKDFEFISLLAALILATLTVWRNTCRGRIASCACLIAFALALVLCGCSTSGYNSSGAAAPTDTPKGPASFTVSGTSGTTTISTTVEVMVQ